MIEINLAAKQRVEEEQRKRQEEMRLLKEAYEKEMAALRPAVETKQVYPTWVKYYTTYMTTTS